MSHGKCATCVRATSELRTENVNECKIGLKSEKFEALQRRESHAAAIITTLHLQRLSKHNARLFYCKLNARLMST